MTWIYLTNWGLEYGTTKAYSMVRNGKTSITAHLLKCKFFLIFVSENALESDYVISELEIASTHNKNIIPVFLHNIDNPNNTVLMDYTTLLRKHGIPKWQFGEEVRKKYYAVLADKLDKLDRKFEDTPPTRDNPFERDFKVLGINELPDIEDTCENKTLTEEEKEERHRKWVQDAEKNGRYEIENVFQITLKTTGASENLGKLDIFDSDPNEPTNLLELPLQIGQAYLAPLRLLTGPITLMEDNWPPLVTSYSALVREQGGNRLSELHYFVEFCWQAWGPSVLSTSLQTENQKFIIVQAAFGDEANSIPLIMKQKKWDEVKLHLKKETGSGHYSGWPVSLKNILIVRPGEDDFFKEIKDYPLFKDMFSDAGQIALYLPQNDKKPKKQEENPENDKKAKESEEYPDGEVEHLSNENMPFYSTAYVWLMLEQITKEELNLDSKPSARMEPGKVIPFFEHANLATSKGLEFLEHCLARKAIYHVLECEKEPEYRDQGYYRFATALFPEKMVSVLQIEICKLSSDDQKILKDRLLISQKPGHQRDAIKVMEFAGEVWKSATEAVKTYIKNKANVM